MKLAILLLTLSLSINCIAQSRIVDHRHIDLSAIPDEYIEAAKSELHIYFGRRSHGRNVTTGGMAAITRYSTDYANSFNYNSTGSGGALHLYEAEPIPADAGWEDAVRNYLNANPECNVMLWGMSNNFVNTETTYTGQVGYNNALYFIETLEELISEYGPGGSLGRAKPVTFVFTTPVPLARFPKPLDHSTYSNDWGKTRDWYAYASFRADSLIRAHCISHNRFLLDIYDIATTTPEGQHYGGRNANGTYNDARRALDDCSYSQTDANHTRANWALDWMTAHPTHENTLMSANTICQNCEHSNGVETNYIGVSANARLQCVLKGKAVWYLWATLAGWGGYSVLPDNAAGQGCRMSCDPYSRKLFVTFDNYSGKPWSVEVTDMQGRKVLKADRLQANSADYTLPEACKGIFVATVNCGTEKFNQKIVIL